MHKYITLCFLASPLLIFSQARYTRNSALNLKEAIQVNEATPDRLVHNGPEAVSPFDPDMQRDLSATPEGISYKQVYAAESPMGRHVQYQQHYKGIPVYGSYYKINTDKQGHIISVVNHLAELHDGFATDPASVDGADFLLWDGAKLHALYKKNKVLCDASGEKVKALETRFYLDDTTASGKVFNHDPLTTAGVIYGQDGSWKHFNDSDYALLNDQRIDVNFPATFNGSVFRLESQFAVMEDIAPPANTPPVSATPQFNFTRSQNGFKEVMAYYHVLHTRDYFMSLGFTGKLQYKQRIDAHSGTGDNSFFSPDDTTLNFGTGGIPDAEDGDVPCHEYTHALSFDINPTPIQTQERRAIEEGMCDVTAAIQSKKTTPFNWRLLFNFDGPNPSTPGAGSFWGGRSAQSSKTYANLQGNPYRDCEIWSSCLLDIAEHATVGHDTLMMLMLNSIYYLTQGTTMPQAAQYLIDTDSLMFGGRHKLILGYYFNERELGDFMQGIASVTQMPAWFRLKNTSGFASGHDHAVLQSDIASPFLAEVYDLFGRKVFAAEATGELDLHPGNFGKGIYILNVTQDGYTFQQKLMRFE